MRFAGALCALSSVMVLAWGGTGCVGAGRTDSAVAAVADAKGKVVLVDLERGRVIDSFETRSWVAGVCADEGMGGFVTAQSGGVGREADNGVGLIGIRNDRSVRYIDLPRPNPLGVERVAAGRVLVDHGWEEKDGTYVCLVDTSERRLVKEGHIPDNNGPVRLAAGSVWSPGVDPRTDLASLRRVDVTTLESTEVPTAPGTYPCVECEGPHGLYGWLRDRDGGASLARFDRATGAVRQAVEADLVDGAGPLISAGDLLVAVDFSGEDLKDPGDRLVVYDESTLVPVRSIRLDGGPCDAVAWGHKVVVATLRDRRLVVVDPRSGTVEQSVRLPALAPFRLMLAVLERR